MRRRRDQAGAGVTGRPAAAAGSARMCGADRVPLTRRLSPATRLPWLRAAG